MSRARNAMTPPAASASASPIATAGSPRAKRTIREIVGHLLEHPEEQDAPPVTTFSPGSRPGGKSRSTTSPPSSSPPSTARGRNRVRPIGDFPSSTKTEAPLAHPEDRRPGDGQRLAGAAGNLDGAEHLGLQLPLETGELDADPGRPRRRIEGAGNPVDRAVEGAAGKRGQDDPGRRPHGQPGHVEEQGEDVGQDQDAALISPTVNSSTACPPAYCPCTSMPGLMFRKMTSP